MTNEERMTGAVAKWVTEARTALGLSRPAVEKLVASAGGNRGSVWRNEQGRATTEELARLTIVLRKALADVEARCEAAKKLLITTAVPKATVELVPAKAKAEPKPEKKIAAKPTTLDDLTVAELRKLARERGLSTVTKLSKKAELVSALDAAAQATPAAKRKVTAHRAATSGDVALAHQALATVENAATAKPAPAKSTPAAAKSRRTTTRKVTASS
jgi:DNA-binding protein HU-beta